MLLNATNSRVATDHYFWWGEEIHEKIYSSLILHDEIECHSDDDTCLHHSYNIDMGTARPEKCKQMTWVFASVIRTEYDVDSHSEERKGSMNTIERELTLPSPIAYPTQDIRKSNFEDHWSRSIFGVRDDDNLTSVGTAWPMLFLVDPSPRLFISSLSSITSSRTQVKHDVYPVDGKENVVCKSSSCCFTLQDGDE